MDITFMSAEESEASADIRLCRGKIIRRKFVRIVVLEKRLKILQNPPTREGGFL